MTHRPTRAVRLLPAVLGTAAALTVVLVAAPAASATPTHATAPHTAVTPAGGRWDITPASNRWWITPASNRWWITPAGGPLVTSPPPAHARTSPPPVTAGGSPPPATAGGSRRRVSCRRERMTSAAAGRRTAGLVALLLVVAMAAAAETPTGLAVVPLPAPPALIAAAVTGAVAVTEVAPIHLEFRRQSFTLSFAAVAMLVGAVTLPDPWMAVAASSAGTGVALLIRRLPPLKTAFNLATAAAETALNIALIRLLALPAAGLDARTLAVVLLVHVAVDQLVAAVVVRVITWHDGTLPRREVFEVHLSGAVTATLSATCAGAAVGLLDDGVGGLLVLGLCVVAGVAAYRGYQVLHRRHRGLQQVHDFVADPGRLDDVRELAVRRLREVRSLLRAARAELHLAADATVLGLAVDDRDRVGDVAATEPGPDDVLARVRASGRAHVVASTTRDPAERAWLADRGARDAVAVRLSTAGADGVLVVFDRLGDTGTFGAGDRDLLSTLSGHLVVALRSTSLLDRLRHDAGHDRLTGLANRLRLEEHAEAALADGLPAAVLLLDLDRFREVNDTLGHPVGDLLLRTTATRVAAAVPAQATVARLGGDEFAVLVPGAIRRGDLASLAARVAEAVAEPVDLGASVLTTRASVGIAVAGPGDGAADLIRHADTAMYAAKDAGGGTAAYSEELDRGRAERLGLLTDLRLALDAGALTVAYQPKVDLDTGRVGSVEALVRWRHPRLGDLSPAVFVPLAETNGLIDRLTTVVLDEALAQCARWRAEGLDLSVAVNLSARVVASPTLPELVGAALFRAGVPARRLILEITESSVLEDPERAVEVLDRIASLGVTLSLDDFGTGYSSLAYLDRLPVREVKIDRSFVSRLDADDPRSLVLVRAITSLSTELGHRVVAEGAERPETVEVLRALGCHTVQGWVFSAAEPPDRLAAFVRGRNNPGGGRLRLADNG